MWGKKRKKKKKDWASKLNFIFTLKKWASNLNSIVTLVHLYQVVTSTFFRFMSDSDLSIAFSLPVQLPICHHAIMSLTLTHVESSFGRQVGRQVGVVGLKVAGVVARLPREFRWHLKKKNTRSAERPASINHTAQRRCTRLCVIHI